MNKFDKLKISSGSDVTNAVIAAVESRLACRFPLTYLELVKYCDEPRPEAGAFDYDGNGTCISEFFKFSDKVEDEYGILSKPSSDYGLPAQIIPFARDAGDFLICFDFRKGGDRVVIFDPGSGELAFVAESFEGFLDIMHE